MCGHVLSAKVVEIVKSSRCTQRADIFWNKKYICFKKRKYFKATNPAVEYFELFGYSKKIFGNSYLFTENNFFEIIDILMKLGDCQRKLEIKLIFKQ